MSTFTEDLELERRIRAVLADLARVSEASAGQVGRSSPSAEEDRQIPQGVRIGRANPDRPPSKDRSLYDFYAWHFARARTDHQRRLFLFLAETDLDQRRHKPPEQMTALGSHLGREVGDERDHRIISWYEGISALEVAVLESAHAGYCSEANVRKVRSERRRDQNTGHPLPGWYGWSTEQRIKEIRSRLNLGRSMRSVARELDTSLSNVQRELDRAHRPKAA
jgi:hypothetical protein